MIEPYYVHKIQAEFLSRKKKTRNYSLRSFAKYLNMDASTLSAILKLKRPLPLHKLEYLATRLDLNEDESFQFLQSVIGDRFYLRSNRSRELQRKNSAKKKLSNSEHFEILSQWEFYAILTLFELKDFNADISYIAKRLGLRPQRAQYVWDILVNNKLIHKNKGGLWEKSSRSFITSEDVTSMALRKAHFEELEIAKDKLHRVPLLDKDYSSVMVAIPKKNLTKAKKMIRKFRQDFSSLIEESTADQVYMLAIQFFPLTRDP